MRRLKKHNLIIVSVFVLLIIILSTTIFVFVKRNQRAAVSRTDPETPLLDGGPGAEPNDEDNGAIPVEDGIKFELPIENSRPYAVMIDNEGTKSLPQGGLNMAQLIYEVIVEGGETRLMPVFWNVKPEMIGPVRSSRHYFLDYAMEHNPIYVHFGWSPMAQNDISKFKINNINGITEDGTVFWDLTKDKNNWQDSYTSMERLETYAKKRGYPDRTENKLLFSYNREDIVPKNGEKALDIELTYSHAYKCGFSYDEESLSYKRTRKGEPHMERVTGEQLRAKNIIIQQVKSYTISSDTEGRQEVETVGKGSGWLITCGKAIKIEWSKPSREKPSTYLDEEGNAIILNPGQTWIQIVPLTGKIKIE